MIIVYKNVKA